jgi:energy-coupling factor transporter ATP-binding protein EcfA2
MYVTKIRGTVKGKVEAELGPKTIIVGPNGSGKTRIQNTLELALLGYATDVVGRAEMRKESDLITLAYGDDLIAEATLSDGRVSSWSTKRTATGAKKAEHVRSVNAYFPVQDVRAALTGSVETARKWLLQRIASSVSRPDVTRYLTGDSPDRYEKKAKMISGDEVSILVTILESARSEKRSKTAELNALDKTIAALSADLGVEPTAAQVAEAQDAYNEAVRFYENLVKNTALVSQKREPEVVKAEALSVIAERDNVSGELESLLPFVQTYGGPLTEQEDALRLIRFTLAESASIHTKHGVGTCLLCENPAPFNAAAREAQLEAANKDAALRVRLNERIVALSAKVGELTARATSLVAEYDKVLAEPDFMQSGTTVDEARVAMSAASSRLHALSNAAKRHEDVRAQKQQERQLKRDIRDAEELTEGCVEAVGALLKTATVDFIKKTQSFLPAEDNFDLVLNDNDKEVCRFGFVRDGVLHTALSGAEWARLTLALACAANKATSDMLLVFTPEERAFDPQTLRSVLLSLSDAPGQVILCSPVKPAGKLPKGWTMVETVPTE